MADNDQINFVQRFRRKEELFLENEFPQLFHTSQCRMPGWLYVSFRVFLVAVTLHSFVLALLYSHNQKFAIFFTHWTYFVQTVTMIYKLVVVVYHVGLSGCHSTDPSSTIDGNRRLPIYLKIKWILHNVSSIVPVIVTIVYWGMLFPVEDKSQMTDIRMYIDVEMHAGNSVVAVLDFFVSAVPFRLYHFVHAVAYGTLYVAFALVYWLCGGTGPTGLRYIYFFLDFGGKPLLTVGVLIAIIITIAVFHLLFAFFKQLQSERCCTFANYTARSSRQQNVAVQVLPTASKQLVDSGKVGHSYVNEAVTYQSNAF